METTAREAPLLFYGTDWLAFGHFVIAIAFVGPLRDPVRNRWLYQFGMIACALVPLWALVFGHVRGIPVWWRLVDASFGIIGFLPMWLCNRWALTLEAGQRRPRRRGEPRMPPELVDRDTEQLKLLAMFHYASAGVAAFVGSFPLLHVAMGAFFAFMPESMRGTGKDALPREFGFLFMGIGLSLVAAGWSLSAAHFFTARFLKQRRHFLFCVVTCAVASVLCTFSSGIVGIASLVVLLRPGVKDLFDAGTGIEGSGPG